MRTKTTLFILFATATVLLVIASCSKDKGPAGSPEEDLSPVAATVYADIITRAHDDVWDEGDAIGLAMLTEDGNEIVNEQYNFHYFSPTSGGVFEPADGGNILYFPTDGNLVTFRAYYPYYSGLEVDMDIPINVSNQNNLPAIDFLSADHISGNSYRNPEVHLQFHHRLTKIIFDFDNTDGNDVNLSEVELTIEGMYTEGDYILLSEILTVNESSMADIVLPLRAANTDIRYGIVLPRPAGSGVIFHFYTPSTGATYSAQMGSDLVLEQGKQYIFHVSLNRTGVTSITTEIIDWIYGSEEWLDANLPSNNNQNG